MKLAPGDLLVLKWLKLDGQPMSSYLIICVQDESFWYFHAQMERVQETNFEVIMEAVKNDELEIVEVVRAREGLRQVP